MLPPETDPEFGREIVRRKELPQLSVIPVAFGILAIILGVVIAFAGNGGSASSTEFLIGLIFIAAGLLLIGLVFLFRHTKILFEQGAEVRGRFGKRRLAYADVGECTIARVRRHVKGAYIGTYVTLALAPARGVKARRVALTIKATELKEQGPGIFSRTKLIYQPNELDSLASYISTHVAERLLARVDAGETIPWGSNLSVSRECITVKGFARRTPVPWSEFRGIHTDEKDRAHIVRAQGEPLRISWPDKTPNLEATSIVVATLSGADNVAPPVTPATGSM